MTREQISAALARATRAEIVAALVLDVFDQDPHLRALGPSDRRCEELELRARLADEIGDFLGQCGERP